MHRYQVMKMEMDEEFYHKMGYIHFGQFEIFAFVAVDITENNKKICDTFDHNFKTIP